jgi:hypothetical protein
MDSLYATTPQSHPLIISIWNLCEEQARWDRLCLVAASNLNLLEIGVCIADYGHFFGNCMERGNKSHCRPSTLFSKQRK